MQTISLKMENKLLKDVDKTIKKHRYSTRTEFIRDSMRRRLVDLEKEEALLRAKALYGASKRKTTDAELHKAGEKAFKELEKELK